MNLTEAVARACQEPSLEKALEWIAVWENDRTIAIALENERAGAASAASPLTCFGLCFQEVMKLWESVGVEWAWKFADEADHNEIYGPFPSRDEAVADARKFLISVGEQGTHEISVGTCIWAKPSDYLPSAESVIEAMAVIAVDNDFGFCDEDDIFDVTKEQMRNLDDLLDTWARGLPHGRVFIIDKIDTETLDLSTKPSLSS